MNENAHRKLHSIASVLHYTMFSFYVVLHDPGRWPEGRTGTRPPYLHQAPPIPTCGVTPSFRLPDPVLTMNGGLHRRVYCLFCYDFIVGCKAENGKLKCRSRADDAFEQLKSGRVCHPERSEGSLSRTQRFFASLRMTASTLVVQTHHRRWPR